jgi:hypothetical protein
VSILSVEQRMPGIRLSCQNKITTTLLPPTHLKAKTVIAVTDE